METLAYFHLALYYETGDGDPELDVISSSPQATRNFCPENCRTRLNRLSRWGASLLGMTAAITLGVMPKESLATLQHGDRGNPVKETQTRLQELGYFSAQTTGYYGQITQSSVLRFQRDRGLKPDGIVGPQTRAALSDSATQIAQNAEPAPVFLGEGSQGTAVRSLQQRLRALGFYRGEITGRFDAATKDAVMRFQQAQGLKPDGVVGPRTFTALGQASAGQARPSSPPTTASSNPPAPQITYLGDGSQGTAVRSLQQRLRSLGYYQGEITGTFDSATKDAVMTFQLDRGLKPDGVVGPRTFALLGSATPAPRATQPPPQPAPAASTARVPTNPNELSPERVKELQQRLQELGFYQGPVDGLWGANTQTALENAQRFYGVSREDIINGQ